MQTELQHEVPLTEADRLPTDGWDLESMVGGGRLRLERSYDEQDLIAHSRLAQRAAAKSSPGWFAAALVAELLCVAAPFVVGTQPPEWMLPATWLTCVAYLATLSQRRIARAARHRRDGAELPSILAFGDGGLYFRSALFDEWQDWSALGPARLLPEGFLFDAPSGLGFLPSRWFTPGELEQLRQHIRRRLPLSGMGGESQPLPGGRELSAPSLPALPGAIRFSSTVELDEYRVARPLCRRRIARWRKQELVTLALCGLMALVSPWPWPLAWLGVALLPAVVLAELLTSLRGCLPRYAMGGGHTEWQVGDEGIMLAHPWYCGRRSWQCYPESAELPDHFVLWWMGFVPHLVAKRCLTDEQAERLRELLLTHTHYRRHR